MSFLTVELRNPGLEVLERVFDEGALGHLRPPLDDDSSACLRFIDPYGNTVFNTWQAAALRAELDAKVSNIADADDRERVSRIIELATTCANRVHSSLWFIGD